MLSTVRGDPLTRPLPGGPQHLSPAVRRQLLNGHCRVVVQEMAVVHHNEQSGSTGTRHQHLLAIPDVIISAAARSAGLIVLHYDADFERVGAVGGAEQEWVAPRGSL